MGVPEVITLSEVKNKHPLIKEDWFASLVKQLAIETANDDIHLPSYVDGYLNVCDTIKAAYAQDPLRTIEALDGTMNESPLTND